MHMNKTKFERNSSLEYYHMTCIGKTKHTSQRGLLIQYKFGSELTVGLRTYQITFQECSKLESNVEILPFSVLNT